MSIRLRKLVIVFVVAFIGGVAQASPPNLSINPQDYSYDLSITAILDEDCQELKNPANVLIAYVKGQLRGFANSSVLVGNRHMAFLTVYSNVPSGDTVTFQIYNAEKDLLIPVKTKIVFQDDAVFGSPAAPHEIITNNRPANLALSGLIIPEHILPDGDIATISATDADLDNTLTYSLVSGTNDLDNASFKIVGNKIQFNGKVNTQAKDTFKIRLRAADNFSCYTEKGFSFIVGRVNDVPTDLTLSDSSFFENTPNPTIGFLVATDQDLGDSFTYALSSGAGDTDNSLFLITNSSIVFKGSANYEVKSKYSIRCKVTDSGGLSYEEVFNIYVKDNNDNPTAIVLSNSKVFENEPKNQLVAKLSTIDEDAVDKYIYTFANLGTNDNNTFTISNDSLRANLIFDFETKSSYFIYLTSTDSSGLFVTRQFIISIKDTFDIPTGILLTNNSIAENLPVKSLVGVLSTEDANMPRPAKYIYTLVAGAGDKDNVAFKISNDSLYSDSTFNFEAKKDYSVRVKTELPNGMSTEKVFALSVLDVNETPTLITLSKDTIAENKADSSGVAILTTIDQEGGNNFVYTLVSGLNDDDNAAFTFVKDVLILIKSANYEKKSTYKLRIRTTDVGGEFLELPFTVSIIDKNEKPLINIESYQVPESSVLQTPVGSVTIKEVDNNQTHQYDIRTPGVPFVIDRDNGTLTLSSPVDYETKKSYDFWVKVTDSGFPALSDSAKITVVVLDEIEGSLPSADLVTPNGDGKNDTWKITNVELYKDYSLKIVDEYSQLVFSVDSNYANEWDARLNGSALPSGIYYYIFKSNSDGKLFKGYVTVIK